ncbi:MAG TPA: hypothetical protein VEL76_19705 [Gemmataceae bacterium]|nr:hypothetical protein [Gemmataceae bacterium]
MEEKHEQPPTPALPESPSLELRDSPGEKPQEGAVDWQGYDPSILSTVLDD